MKTDSQLYMDIEERLTFQPGLNSSHVDLSVHNGVVKIEGEVDNYLEKRLIKHTIRSVNGVRRITDEMGVKPVNSPNIPILLK